MKRLDVGQIVSGAYDAALDQSLWAPWAESLTEFLGGVGSVFFVMGAADRDIRSMVTPGGRANELVEEYATGWWQADPQISKASGLRESTIYLDTDHVDLSDRGVAEYFRWQRARGRFDHHMTAVALLGPGDVRAGISVHRDIADGHTPRAERDKLERLFPDITRSLELGYRYGEMLQSAYWDGLIVGRAHQAAFLLDEGGRVIRNTDTAGAMLTGRDCLTIRERRLSALLPSENSGLQAIIARATAARGPVSGATRAKRQSGLPPLVLVCYPLQRSSRMLAPAEAAALLVAIDPVKRALSQTDLYRQAFGLTMREAEMAAALVNGHSIGSAAATLRLSMPTARTHMRRVFEKTGSPSQGTLISLLSRIT